MSILRSIVLCSALVGLSVWPGRRIAQHFATVPLILEGEVYEKAAESGSTPTRATLSHEAMGHEHSAEAWQPADGLERTIFTVVANILTATGYALVLTGLFVLRGRPVSWREGLVWGLTDSLW
jgi:predicted cobalt transporter CbtA